MPDITAAHLGLHAKCALTGDLRQCFSGGGHFASFFED